MVTITIPTQNINKNNTLIKDYLTGDNSRNEVVAETLEEIKNENINWFANSYTIS